MTETEWIACDDPSDLLKYMFDVGKIASREINLVALAAASMVSHWFVDTAQHEALASFGDLIDDPRPSGEFTEAENHAIRIENAFYAQCDRRSDSDDGPAMRDDEFDEFDIPRTPTNERLRTIPGVHAAGGAAAVLVNPLADLRRGSIHPIEVLLDMSCRTAADVFFQETAFVIYGNVDASADPEYHLACRAGEARAKQALAAMIRDIVGNPFRPRRFEPSWRTADVLALARAAYDGDVASLPVLADALEDAGGDAVDLLDHLRGPGPHVRGCWAVDEVLGMR